MLSFSKHWTSFHLRVSNETSSSETLCVSHSHSHSRLLEWSVTDRSGRAVIVSSNSESLRLISSSAVTVWLWRRKWARSCVEHMCSKKPSMTFFTQYTVVGFQRCVRKYFDSIFQPDKKRYLHYACILFLSFNFLIVLIIFAVGGVGGSMHNLNVLIVSANVFYKQSSVLFQLLPTNYF